MIDEAEPGVVHVTGAVGEIGGVEKLEIDFTGMAAYDSTASTRKSSINLTLAQMMKPISMRK